jgi:sec-independent protein translocase protein TatA
MPANQRRFAMFGLGGMEIAVLAALGLLLFGKRLPEMGRYFGGAITSFRKGLAGIEDDIDDAVNRPSLPKPPEKLPPRFEPPADGSAPASI